MTLNKSELVVNKNPDIALKVVLDYKKPTLFEHKKQENLDKMSKAMVKLDGRAESEKVRFEKRLNQEKKKRDKLQELIEIEEYE
jgi:hypothetical protein